MSITGERERGPCAGVPVWNRLPLTRVKLAVAMMLYRVLHLVLRNDRRRIIRKGIHYEVDISEGIDLSIFLLGGFQRHVTASRWLSLPRDGIVIDVGANCGSMALRFAQVLPAGHVYAFEPTHYAFAKMKRNMELNPDLAARITAVQSFVSDKSSSRSDMSAYSSWRVDARRSGDHTVHGGHVMSSESVPVITVDDFCTTTRLKRLDLIKIDTDGHEYRVLQGARRVMAEWTPAVIFESGLYVMEEEGISFEQYWEHFCGLGYVMMNSKTGEAITLSNHRRRIPLKGTIDVLALAESGRK